MGQVQSNVTSIIPHIQSFNVSDFTSGSIPTKNIGNNDNVNNAVSITDKLTDKLLRKHFTHLEDYSLKASFDSLCVLDKSTNISYIDEKTFTDYLNIPVEIGAGPLIYRSFINLGNYPSSSSSSSSNARDSDMHLLTYNSLVKAVAIYCNKFRDVIDEDRLKLIFYSFSIPSDHKNGSKNHNDDGRSNDFSEPSSPQISTSKDNDNFRSLFEQDDDDNSPKLRSQDLVKILTALVWIMSSEMSLTTTTEQGTSTFVTKPEGLLECSKNLTSSQNVHQIRDAIISIADNASRYNDRSSSDRSSGSDQGSTESSSGIVWTTFKQFVERNMPNVFDGFTRFFYNQFLIGQTLSQKRKDSSFLGPQTTYWPTLDRKSNILDQVNMAILSWMLPNKATRKRVWNRLYVGNLHGFSMSSFSNHVFNYPGPTLMLIRAEIIDKRTSFSTALTMKKTTETNIKNNNNDNSSQRQTLLLGAYVAETWRSTSSLKACFGSDEFFLFEIWPTLEVFPTTKRNTKYAYYNPSFGIGFGGLPIAGQTSGRIGSQNASSFVLQLDNTLQHGKYRNDMLNELSPTYSLSKSRGYFDISFEVLELEVFGLEGGAALEKQKKELEWEVKEANKRKGFRRHSSKNTDFEILKLSGIIDDKSRKEIIRREASL